MGYLTKVSVSIIDGTIEPYDIGLSKQASAGNFHDTVRMYIVAASEINYSEEYFKKLEEDLKLRPTTMYPMVQKIYDTKKDIFSDAVRARFEDLLNRYSTYTDIDSPIQQQLRNLVALTTNSLLRKFSTDVKELSPEGLEEKLSTLYDVLQVAPDNWEALSNIFADEDVVRDLQNTLNIDAFHFFSYVKKAISSALAKKTWPNLELGSLINENTVNIGGN